MRVATTSAILGSVQMSLANPEALAPRRSAFSTAAGSAPSGSGRRPARPAPLSPFSPPRDHAPCQRPTLWREASDPRATSAWAAPLANSLAACLRRASMPSKFRWGARVVIMRRYPTDRGECHPITRASVEPIDCGRMHEF